MLNIYLQNEPMTNTIAAPVEQKRPHEMLETPWIILYNVCISFENVISLTKLKVLSAPLYFLPLLRSLSFSFTFCNRIKVVTVATLPTVPTDSIFYTKTFRFLHPLCIFSIFAIICNARLIKQCNAK